MYKVVTFYDTNKNGQAVRVETVRRRCFTKRGAALEAAKLADGGYYARVWDGANFIDFAPAS